MFKWNPHPKQLEFINDNRARVLYEGVLTTRSVSAWTIIRRFLKMKYTIDPKMKSRLDNDFQYHAPKDDQPERYIAIRTHAKELAIAICENTPPSREQSVALTELDHVVMMANAAIARNE